MVIERSALVATAADADPLLLPGVGSPVAVAEAPLLMVPVAFEGTLNVEVIVTLPPARIVARLQGKAVVQAPLFETNVRPALGVSETTTPGASDGPALETTMLKTTFCPATTGDVVIDLVMLTSETAAMATPAEAVFGVVGSKVADVTLPVRVIVPG